MKSFSEELTELNQEIHEAKIILGCLMKQKERLESEHPIETFAEFLHKKLCKYNHTDGCTWYYEQNDWNKFAHQEYYKMAESLIDTKVSIEDIKKIMKILFKSDLKESE